MRTAECEAFLREEAAKDSRGEVGTHLGKRKLCTETLA